MKRLPGVFYGRVSTNDQAEGGYSLRAQLGQGVPAARAAGIEISPEEIYIESQSATSAKQRPEFERAIAAAVRLGAVIVSDEYDRLIRTHRDRSSIDAAGIMCFFYLDGMWHRPDDLDGNEGDYLKVELKHLLAVTEGRKKRRRVKKGMAQKAREGVFPGKARLGYLNHSEPVPGSRKPVRSIRQDPETAPLVLELFRRYETGGWSDKALAEWVWDRGLRSSRGSRLSHSRIRSILTSPFYMGEYTWCGETFRMKGCDPIVPEDLWHRCQSVRASKAAHGGRTPSLPYAGKIECGCGCGLDLVWQEKTQRHGHTYRYGKTVKRKHRPCSMKSSVREEVVDRAFQDRLTDLRIPDTFIEALKAVVKDRLDLLLDREEGTRERLRRKEDALTARIRAATRERVGGNLTADELEDHQAVVQEWRAERAAIRQDQSALVETTDDVEEAIAEALELAAGAHKVWADLRDPVKRVLAGHLADRMVWEAGELKVTWNPDLQEFLARTRAASALEAKGGGLLERAAIAAGEGRANPANPAPQTKPPAFSDQGLRSVVPMGASPNPSSAPGVVDFLHRLARRRASSPELREALEEIRKAA